jgi:hypothetical protein
VTLLHNLLLEQDKYYSKAIKGLDETMLKKMHNVFMNRWSVFHVLIHSGDFEMDKQFGDGGDQEGHVLSVRL